jgi:excisionase family DNA binding protein
MTPLAHPASEARDLLGVSRDTVMRLFNEGRLSGCRLGSGPKAHVLISRASLLRLLGENPDVG